MTEFGLLIIAQYSMLSDQELDNIVQTIRQQFPMCGNKTDAGPFAIHRVSCSIGLEIVKDD